jgi:hypothetical protein
MTSVFYIVQCVYEEFLVEKAIKGCEIKVKMCWIEIQNKVCLLNIPTHNTHINTHGGSVPSSRNPDDNETAQSAYDQTAGILRVCVSDM